MIKLYFTKSFLIISTLLPVNFAISQNENTYTRPAVSNVFISNGASNENVIFNSFANIPMETRFDSRALQTRNITFQFPTQPVPVPAEKLKGLKDAIKKHKEVMANWRNQCEEIKMKQFSLIGREIVADQWSRDSEGNFDYEALMKAAAYSATDADALKSSASADKGQVYTAIADKLLAKNYIITYTIKQTQTMQEYYDAQDKSGQETAAITKKEYKPVKRTQEGWKITYAYDVYRLIWNDSIQNIFYNDMYLDNSTTTNRNEKVSNFNNATFEMELVHSGTGSAQSTQSNDPEKYKYRKRKSMTELIQEIAPSMQNSAIFSSSKKVEDFKLKVSILSKGPIKAKIGTKEGLYVDQRFFAYEYELDKKGNEIKKKRAVVRAVKIANNDSIATGNSISSTFRQQGGKRIYEGTLLEMKEDVGLGLTMGYIIKDQFVGGLHVGLDFRLTRITGKILSPKVNKFLRSWYINGYLNYSFEGADNIGFIESNGLTGSEISNIVWGSKSASTSSLAFGAGFFRELRITPRSNLYLLPEFGIGLYTFDMEGSNGSRLTASNFYSTLGCGLVWQWSPAVSFIFKTNLYMKGDDPLFAYYDSEDEEATVYGYNGQELVDTFPLTSNFTEILENKVGLTFALRFKF